MTSNSLWKPIDAFLHQPTHHHPSPPLTHHHPPPPITTTHPPPTHPPPPITTTHPPPPTTTHHHHSPTTTHHHHSPTTIPPLTHLHGTVLKDDEDIGGVFEATVEGHHLLVTQRTMQLYLLQDLRGWVDGWMDGGGGGGEGWWVGGGG